ncbi:NAD(P)-dependent alcohol dehydrogenase [Methylosinus sp. Ce-a6]|uniref:zinc-dependent alcohol dehydrogenase family protein n=1 Tax=Methylosinus sp. Ce-a6 TaxID=2172005 RepID=UPI00135BD2AC|nr:NAD(P)-dependent alcohol dehydrogenase [Methylosinus sp. Ce-a6]
MSGSMRVWRLRQFGVDNLERADIPIPPVGEGELLIRVAAVSLNYRDSLVAEGRLLAEPPALPFTPVSDFAGAVVETGAGVTRFRVGDRVMGNFWTRWIDGEPPVSLCRYGESLGGPLPGALADYIVLPETVAVRSPSSLSDEQASTLPIAALTAWFALVETGRLAAGESVLIQGTGGVSLFGLQIARALGARTIVLSRDAAKLRRVEALGADHGVDTSQTPEWSAAVLALTDGRGVNHILETIGGDNLRRSMEALASGGRISQIGLLAGETLQFPALPFMLRRAILQGVAVGHRRAFEDLVEAIDRLAIAPVVDHVYGFDEAPKAFAHLGRGPFGKVIVSMAR